MKRKFKRAYNEKNEPIKILNEADSRAALFSAAYKLGGDQAVTYLKQVFHKWDLSMQSCKNPQELEMMKKMALIEIDSFLGGDPSYLTIDGKPVINTLDKVNNGTNK